jgi:NAD(P)-dependent dehydrogenase (short-subunit alcohol dehydrogenase family)
MTIKSKTVLVTGAARGIGLAITEYLVEMGDHVVAVDIDRDTLAELPDSGSITKFHMDVTDAESINEVFISVTKKFSGIDGVVNNAGIFIGGPLVELAPDDMERIMAVNVMGVFKVTSAFYPLLRANKGRIVNIGSESGRFAFPLNGPYSMTKFALEAFSDSLRREAVFHDVKVIHLQIGAVNTPFLQAVHSSYAKSVESDKSAFRKQLKSVVAVCKKEMDKSADPRIVAKAVHKALHKRSPRARYRIKNSGFRRFMEFLPTSLVDKVMEKALK